MIDCKNCNNRFINHNLLNMAIFYQFSIIELKELIDFLEKNQKINATKLVKKVSGENILTSKRIVDSFMAPNP